MVQGGYNAVLTEPDSLEAHLLDTLAGGGFINDQELVWTLVSEAPRRALELEWRYGCLFDRTREGRIHQKPFAGQSHDRTIHKGDLTGIEIMNRLTEQTLARPNVTVFEECRAVELLRDAAGRAAGALVLDLRTGRFVAVRAPATLLAMGGGPTMYRVIACSADKAADGVALAYRAGLPLRDMEMVQFHPTGLVIPGSLMTGALLEEGLRGAGGVNGASRVGGNGVAESTVFGGIAGDVMAESVAGGPLPRVAGVALEDLARRVTAPLERPATRDLYALQRELRDVMWEEVGLVRDARGLAAALNAIDSVAERLAGVGVPGGPALNLAWQDWLNLENQAMAARLITRSALARRESRGAHFRRDFPVAAPGPLVSVRVQARDSVPAVWEEPVAFTRATPDGAVAVSSMIEIGD